MNTALKPYYLFSLLFLLACEPETVIQEPVVTAPQEAIHYDGPFQTAPFFIGNQYEGAVRLSSQGLAGYDAHRLVEVYYFIASRPASCTIKIYEGSNGDSPGDLIYTASTAGSLTPQSWNHHILSNPVDINGSDLWISVKFSHANDQATLGCDSGPGHPDGDWLWDSADSSWQRYLSRTQNEANINWNIRAVVEPI